jgi:hypothetical protein
MLWRMISCPSPHPRPSPLEEVHLCQPAPFIFLDAAIFPVCTLRIDLCLPGHEINVHRLDTLGLLHNQPYAEHNGAEGWSKVGGDEALRAPWHETVKADEEDHYEAKPNTPI